MDQVIKEQGNPNKDLARKAPRKTPTTISHFANGHQLTVPKPHYHIKPYAERNVSNNSNMGFNKKFDRAPSAIDKSPTQVYSLDKIGGDAPDMFQSRRPSK